MGGYLSPNQSGPDSPYSHTFQAQYTLKASPPTPSQATTHHLHIQPDEVPQPNTLITAGPAPYNPLVSLPPIGSGIWGWGDVLNYGWGPSGSFDKENNEENTEKAFKSMIDIFPYLYIDGAEHYGYTSEHTGSYRLFWQVPTHSLKHPWQYPGRVLQSCSESISRTQMDHIDIYQLHGPSYFGFWPRGDTLIESLARTYHTGQSKHIGTCNMSLDQVKYIDAGLKRLGVESGLVSNQVEFSLVRMDPWKSGLIEGARALGIITIAYSPLAVGRLSGKYSSAHPPQGSRNFGDISWTKIQPIVDILLAIGQQVGKTPSAVALNWVICKGAIPIPTCKSVEQVRDAREALGWRLTPDQEAKLDAVGRYKEWDWRILTHFQNWWWQQG